MLSRVCVGGGGVLVCLASVCRPICMFVYVICVTARFSLPNDKNKVLKSWDLEVLKLVFSKTTPAWIFLWKYVSATETEHWNFCILLFRGYLINWESSNWGKMPINGRDKTSTVGLFPILWAFRLTVYWHRVNQSRYWPSKDRRLIGWPLEYNVYATGMTRPGFVCWLLACLTSQQQAISVSQGRIYTDNFTCCHTEIAVADQTFYLTQSQCTDTGPTSLSTDPLPPGAWQCSHWNAKF